MQTDTRHAGCLRLYGVRRPRIGRTLTDQHIRPEFREKVFILDLRLLSEGGNDAEDAGDLKMEDVGWI